MAQVATQSVNVEKYGPYGSQLTQNFSLKLSKTECIKQVIIRHGFIVDAIGFVIANSSGGTTTKMFGGKLGGESKIILKSGEYLTQISGTHGEYEDMCNGRLIATLKIHTNLCPAGYGPYGLGKLCKNVANFSSPVQSHGHIVGFFGRHHNFLESLGVEIGKFELVKYGPYGSQLTGNWNWKLGASESIKEVIIRHGFIVDAIGFKFANSSGSIFTKMFGGKLGGESKIILKAGEYLTQISGTHGEYEDMCNGRLIATMKIHTNLRPAGYGPYGMGKLCKNVANFSSPAPCGRIVGFFGRHHNFLESIGVEIEKVPNC